MKTAIIVVLKAAGKPGITVKEIAARLGLNYNQNLADNQPGDVLPSTMLSPRRTKTTGFTTIELLLIVVLMGLLAAVVVPNYIKARNRPSDNACVANLKQIARAKAQWALEHKKSNGTPVEAAAINGYMLKGRAPQCPNNGTYSYNALGTLPTCSLAVRGHTL